MLSDLRLRPLVVLIAALTLSLVGVPAAAAGGGKGASQKPRMKVLKVSDAPAELRVGDTFTTTGRVENKGKAEAAGAEMKLTLSGGDVDRLTVGEATIEGPIGSKEERKYSIEGTIPDSLDPSPDPQGGPYKLRACVRKGGDVGRWKCLKAKGGITVLPKPVYTPGAKTLGDDLFPQIGNGGYDARNYAIDLRYAPATNRFLAGTKTTMTARATQNLSQFSLDFQDLDVTSVTVDGEEAQFTQADAQPEFAPTVPEATQPMKLTITPPQGIDEGDTFKTVVAYEGEPKVITDADTSIEGWIPACYPIDPPQTCDGAFVVGEPIGSQGWFPSNNHPSDKATLDTKITVPQQYTSLGVGELVSKAVNANGNRVWKWTEDDPTATYLATATTGLFDYSEGTMTEASTGRTLDVYNAVDSSAPQADKDAANANIAQQPAILNFLSDVLGPYPFDSTGVVADRAAGVCYALEVQTKAHFSGTCTAGNLRVGLSTLVHEIAHQWLGNSVSPANWKVIWFNEGWATFMEVYWDFAANGGDPPSDFFSLIYDDPGYDWSLAPAELGNDPANLFSSPTYDRSGAMLAGFYEIVGEHRFFSFARTLESRYRYGNITTQEFIDDAVTASGFEGAERAKLRDYFEQWLYGETKPTLTPADFTA